MSVIKMGRKSKFNEPLTNISIPVPLSLKKFLSESEIDFTKNIRDSLFDIKRRSLFCESCGKWTIPQNGEIVSKCCFCLASKKEIITEIEELIIHFTKKGNFSETDTEELLWSIAKIKKKYNGENI
jgi:hypothetical protein